jgi:hypothetical protein
MDTWATIIVGLNVMLLAAMASLVYQLRALNRRTRSQTGRLLASFADLHKDVMVRRVIKSMDEVPPELIGAVARERLAEVSEESKLGAAQVVKIAIEMGLMFSDINATKNAEAGIDDDEPFDPNAPDVEAEPEEGK